MRRLPVGIGLLVPLLMLGGGCLARLHRGEALHDPVPLQTEGQARGQLTYMHHCYRCHQNGEGGLGPTLAVRLPDAAIRKQVRRGVGAMPAFPPEAISDRDLDDLLNYLKALRR